MSVRFSRALVASLLAVTSQGARLRAQNTTKANDTAPTTLAVEKAPIYHDYIVKPCMEVCGKAGAPGKDSSCVTMCEAEMYRCHDHNSTRLDEYMGWRECHDRVLGKYQSYRPNLAFGARRQIVKPCADACGKAGEVGEESSCYSMCETEMFQCHDHNHTVATAEFQACHDAVVAKFETFKSDTSMLLAAKKRDHNLVQPCVDLCTRDKNSGVESSCYTACEADLYMCEDHNKTQVPLDYTACEHKVVAKYQGFHNTTLLFSSERQIVKPCKDACAKAGASGDESSCLTMCEAELFQCHDHNHTVATTEFQACQSDVVTKYEAYHLVA